MVRRGADLVLEGVWDLANAEVCWRDRVLPLSGDKEGMLGKELALIRTKMCRHRMVNGKW